MEEFPYLGSFIASSGGMAVDVDRRVVQASKGFGAPRKAIFLSKNLSRTTKIRLHDACVSSALLYGIEYSILSGSMTEN